MSVTRHRLVGRMSFAVALALVALTFGSGVASAATSRTQATKKALKALGVRGNKKAVRVFALRTPVAAGTAITEAGPAPMTVAGRRLVERATGVLVTPAAPVLRVRGEAAWLYFADRGPHQAFEHPGQIVLVGTRSGRVTLSRSLRWVPLVGGRQPAFFATNPGYEGTRYQVFNRPWPLSAVTSSARARPAKATPQELAAGATADERRTADALAAEQSCAMRYSDSLGDFYDFGRTDWTRAGIGLFFKRLAAMNPGFVSERYTASTGRTPLAAAQRMIDDNGCRDLLVYAAGGAAHDGEPGVVIGVRLQGSRLQWQTLTATDIERLIRANRGVTFKLVFDAPFAGRIAQQLRGQPNIALMLTSGGPNEPSFSYLPEVTGPNGIIRNTGNPEHLLEFTNRLIDGLHRFTATPAEVDNAIRNHSDEFMAWLLARANGLGNSPFEDHQGGPVEIPEHHNVAPVLGGVSGTLAYTEDEPAAALAPALTAGDSDSANLTGASVIVTGGFQSSEDVLGFVNSHGLVGAWHPSTATLTLTGSATVAAYQAALRTVTYRNSSQNPSTAARTVTIRVTDGEAENGTSNAVTRGVAVERVDDTPVLSTTSGSTGYTENAAAVVIDGGVQISDIEDSTLAGARVRVTDGFASAKDDLVFVDQNGITGVYDSSIGELTLSGTASLADYQTALRSVRFRSTDDDPTAPRTIAFRASDADGAGEEATRGVAITPVNDAPVLSSTSSGDAAYTEDGAHATLDPLVAIADPDSASLAGATVSIGTGHEGADRLDFSSQNGISGSYDAVSGVLTLSGASSRVNYQTALRSVQFHTESDDPSETTRQVSMRVDDGASADNLSNVLTRGLTVARHNDLPVLTQPDGALTFTENSTAAPIAPSLTAADPDNANGQSATVTITNGFVSSQDALTYGGAGGLTAALNGAGDKLTLTGSATIATYQAALRDVRYTNTSDAPTTAARTVEFRLTDSSAGESATGVTRTVNVTAINDAPAVDANPGGGSAAFTENADPGPAIAPALTLSDVDSDTLASATASITGNFVSGTDVLVFVDQNGISGSYNAGSGILTLSGSATKADYRTALRSITFRATGDDPSGATRTITFVVNDGGLDSGASTRDVTVAPVNDKPTVTAGAAHGTYTERAAAATIDAAVQLSDPDSANIQGATVKLTGTSFDSSNDDLVFVDTATITGSYDAGTGVLTLSGSDTKANYQAALRSVKFKSAAHDPGTSRSVEFKASDAAATSDAATQTIDITAINEAPTLDAGGGSAAFTENDDPGPAVAPALTVADVDSANLASATASITANFVSSSDLLGFTDQNGISGTYNSGSGVLTLSGSASRANYQAALRTIAFRATGDNPSGATRTVRFVVSDGALDSGTGASSTRDVTVTPVNDKPVVTTSGGSTAFTESSTPTPVTIDAAVAIADPDSGSLNRVTVAITTGHQTSDVLAYATAHGIEGSYDSPSGVMTLTPVGPATSATPADFQSAAREVTFSTPSPAPGPSRTITFRARDTANAESDGAAAAQKTIAITTVNEAPVITVTAGNAGFTEDGGSVPVDGALTVSDGESDTISGATVEITTAFHSGQDALVYPATLHGIAGTVSGGGSKITFSTTGSAADYQDVLRSVRFDNTSNTPNTDTRTVTFSATDTPGDTGATSRNVEVTAANDRPTISVDDTTAVDFTEGDAATPVNAAGAVSVNDVDSLGITGATVRFTGGALSGDVLDATVGSGFTKDFTGGVLTISGTGSFFEYEDMLETVTYRNTSESPAGTQRTLEFVVDDGAVSNNLSTAATRRVDVTPVNDAPALTQPDAALTYTEDDPSPKHHLQIAPNLGVGDVDSANLTGATVTIRAAGYHSGEDVLSVPGALAGGITFSYAAGTATLGGSASVANYQAALRSVRYQNTSDAPATNDRTIDYQVDDGQPNDHASAVVSRVVGVVAVNDVPVAQAKTYDGASSAVGNTTLVGNDATDGAPPTPDPTDTSPVADRPHKTIAANLLAGATDADGPGPLEVVPGTFATTDGGSVAIQSDGDFTFEPKAGTSCSDHSDAFQYGVTDKNNPDGVGTATATVAIAGCVHYVNNDDSQGDAGTSEQPFGTLEQAQTASAAGDSIFVYAGNHTTSGYDAGIDLKSAQKLVGEAAALVVGSDTLHTADPANRPTLTDLNADVVALDDGNDVRGLALDPAGVGSSGIAGGSGDTGGGTIDDVSIADTGVAGAGPGLELDGTAGTFNVSNLTVDNSTATTPLSTSVGVRLNGAGTVNFLAAGTISLTTSGAAALDASSTSMGTSTFDDVTVAGSGSGGVQMLNTTGTTVFANTLSLTTSSGTPAAFGLNSAGIVSVESAGTDDVSAIGGPAVSVSGTTIASPGLLFDSVSSSSSTGNGISLSGLGGATFSATGGSIGGAAGTAFSLSGGSGTVSYPGTLNNGTGQAASITNRTGGAVTLSGNVNDTNDAGGGITVSSNTGGSTTFSGFTKTINTTGLPVTTTGVAMSASDGHTLSFTNGGLDITASTGRGLYADTSGTIEVSGSGNSVVSTTGRAVEIANTDIAGAGVTLQKVSSNGATSGLVLTSTGAGPFAVTGNGAGCTSAVTCTGGAIQNSTGNGVSLTSVGGGASFTRLHVNNSGDDGIHGSSVNGFKLDFSRVASNGNGGGSDDGVELAQLTGTVTFNTTTVTASSHNNVTIANTSGNVSATFTDGEYSQTNLASTTGGDAILLRNDQTGTMNATIQGASFINNRDDHVQATADADSTATLNVTIQNTTMTDTVGQQGNGITVNPGGTSTTELTVNNNTITGSNQAAITVDGPGSDVLPQPANIDATITNNLIGDAATSRSGSWSGVGIAVNSNGGADIDTLISGNQVRQYTNPEGISLVQNDGNGSLNATVRSNVVTDQANTINNLYGIRALYGSTATDNGAGCLDLGGAGAFANNLTGSSPALAGDYDIRLRQAGPTALSLPGYGNTAHNAPAVEAYLVGRNTTTHGAFVSQVDPSATYANAAGCPLP